MKDNLSYIREAIQKHGKFARVKVVRYETNFSTGLPEKPSEIEVAAHFALDQLSKPFNKRIHNFKKIRPIGENIMPNSSLVLDGLTSPDLINQIKEQAKAELEAEMRAKIEAEFSDSLSDEKPKRKKKSDENKSNVTDSDIYEL